MKILVSAVSPDLDSPIDPRFGRAAYFIVVDTNTWDWQAHPNPATEASGGAGTQAAQYVANYGLRVVVSGDFGPNACNALHAAGIGMYLLGPSQTVRQAVENYKAGQLTPVGAPTGAGHHRR
jgi:predicted Fe-Mo cluster-binding NifX family protein